MRNALVVTPANRRLPAPRKNATYFFEIALGPPSQARKASIWRIVPKVRQPDSEGNERPESGRKVVLVLLDFRLVSLGYPD